MAVVAKWLTHRIVAPAFVGSIPIVRPRVCGCSSMVELQPSKLTTWVRFPSPAPSKRSSPYFKGFFCVFKHKISINIFGLMSLFGSKFISILSLKGWIFYIESLFLHQICTKFFYFTNLPSSKPSFIPSSKALSITKLSTSIQELMTSSINFSEF